MQCPVNEIGISGLPSGKTEGCVRPLSPREGSGGVVPLTLLFGVVVGFGVRIQFLPFVTVWVF